MIQDIDDLIARLDDNIGIGRDGRLLFTDEHVRLMREAAAALRAQQTEIARLATDYNVARDAHDEKLQLLLRAESDRDQLRRELQAVRAEKDALAKLFKVAVWCADHAQFENARCQCEQANYGLPEHSHPGYYCEACQWGDAMTELRAKEAAMTKDAP